MKAKSGCSKPKCAVSHAGILPDLPDNWTGLDDQMENPDKFRLFSILNNMAILHMRANSVH